MKSINENNYETRFPYLNSEYYNNLSDKEEYFNEYVTYVKLLLEFLIKNTSIKKIDDIIKNHEGFKYPIESVDKEDEDLYQYLCDEYLSYFYIRNNIYIERLDKEEKKYLDSLINSNDEFNKEKESFIEKTLIKIINEDPETKEEYYLNFGPGDTREYFALNNSLVIGARMMEGIKPEVFKENKHAFFERADYFEEKCEELKSLLKKELSINVSVIIYNDNSVRNISLEENKKL